MSGLPQPEWGLVTLNGVELDAPGRLTLNSRVLTDGAKRRRKKGELFVQSKGRLLPILRFVFKRGSSGVVPLELDEASQKGQGLKFLGDLLGGAGSLATNYGLTKGGATPLFGAKTATTTPGVGFAPASSPFPRPRPGSATLYPTSSSFG